MNNFHDFFWGGWVDEAILWLSFAQQNMNTWPLWFQSRASLRAFRRRRHRLLRRIRDAGVDLMNQNWTEKFSRRFLNHRITDKIYYKKCRWKFIWQSGILLFCVCVSPVSLRHWFSASFRHPVCFWLLTT
jgi:hypothetical protein